MPLQKHANLKDSSVLRQPISILLKLSKSPPYKVMLTMKKLEENFPVTLFQDVIWGDMDAYGHVNNTVYFRYFEDARWEFFNRFGVNEYKLKHKGGVLVEIDRFFPSSKLCSNCGHKYQDLQLKEREWTCEVCHAKHQRDYNAAKNIRLEGIRILGLGHSPHGDGVRLEVEARSGSPTMCNRPVETCSEATICEVSTTLVA